MTQDEIIRMAMDIDGHMNDHARGIDIKWDTLVEIVQTAIANEREACAKVCDEEAESWNEFDYACGEASATKKCAAAIRARGENGTA